MTKPQGNWLRVKLTSIHCSHARKKFAGHQYQDRLINLQLLCTSRKFIIFITRQEMASLPTLKSRKLLQAETENVSGEHDFSVVTYNILADFYLQSALSKGRYKNCPQEFVTPKQDRHCPRHKLLMTEVRNR